MSGGDRTKLEYIEGLVASLRSDPRDAELWAHVAEVLTEAGHFERAVGAYDLALSLDSRLHRAQIGLTVALDLCDADMSQREPPAMRSALWDVLQSLETLVHGLREGRRSLFVDVHAIRLQKETDRRLAADRNDPDALFLRSAFLAKQGRFEDAVAIIDKLMKKTADYPGAVEFSKQLKEMLKLSAPRTTRPRK